MLILTLSYLFYQESGFNEQSEQWETETEASMAAIREEADILHNTLRELASCIIEDTENAAQLIGTSIGSKIERGEEFDEETDNIMSTPIGRARSPFGRNKSPSRMGRMRSVSPVRSRSPAVADSAISAAQAALKKRNLQLQVSRNPYETVSLS